jgi:hypothetical protein
MIYEPVAERGRDAFIAKQNEEATYGSTLSVSTRRFQWGLLWRDVPS